MIVYPCLLSGVPESAIYQFVIQEGSYTETDFSVLFALVLIYFSVCDFAYYLGY